MAIEDKVGGAVKSAIGQGQKSYRNFVDAQEVRKLSKTLTEKGKDLAKLQDSWNVAIEGGKLKHWLSKPREAIYSLASKLPGRAGAHYKGEVEKLKDPFVGIEQQCRSYMNDIEEMIVKIGQLAEEKNAEMEISRANLETAKSENWDIQALRTYIVDNSGISLDASMGSVFEYSDDNLNPEQAEKKKEGMLRLLETNLAVQEESLKLLAVIVRQGAETYEKALMQYYGFKSNAPQVQAFRDAALDLAGTEVCALDMKDMFSQYLDKCTGVAETAIDALSIMEKNRVASPETAEKIRQATEKLRTKLEQTLSGDVKVKTGKVKVKVE